MIERVIPEGDRRAVELSVTDAGRFQSAESRLVPARG